LDDSGYDSPLKPFGGASNDKIQFYVKYRNADRQYVVASKTDTLASVLKHDYPKMIKNMENTLVWGEIRSHTGMKCINPFLLPCGFIKSGTTMEIEEITRRVYDYDMSLEDTKPFSNLQMQGSVFFISLKDRKKKRAITCVNYKKDLRCNDMCVFAKPSQTYKEALKADHRFVGVDNFILKQKDEDGRATIGMDLKPADVDTEMVLDVHVDPTAQVARGTPTMSSTGEPTSYVKETPKKKHNFNELFGKLLEENAIYAFSKAVDDLKDDERIREMENCLKARAWSTLLGPEDRGKNLEKALAKIVKIQFSNNNVVARPVRFTKSLAKFYDSVGFLKCGTITATCFLVSEDMIATNWHVVDEIIKASRSSTLDDHSEVYVHFDYEDNGKKFNLENGCKLKPVSYSENKIHKDLDYALLFLETPVEQVKTLGEFVLCAVPDQGKVCIVGHPNGNEKQDELCAILPMHDDQRSLELERKFEEGSSKCRSNPASCTLVSFARQCVHSYQPQLQNLCHQRETMTYHVGSMGKGASGAPVFDMKCNIVALHTGGFAVDDGNSSIVEYGITFQSIIQHLQSTVSLEFVKKHFPYSLLEDMDTGNI
jgi:V8-like Glu-specific endopeptidase